MHGYEQSTYWLAFSTSVAEKLHALSEDTSFDIIQFPEYCGEGFVYQTDTFQYRKARYVVQLHGPLGMFAEYMGWPECGGTLHQIGCFMERTVIHHSDRVLASSHNTANFCASRYEYPLEKINVIHSGIDAEIFFPSRQPADERFPRILFVGNFTESKGFGLLVRAVLRLKQRYPKICLRAIGRETRSSFLSGLKKQIADASAQSSVQFTGYVPYQALPEHYAWCDFFAGPSTYEPGPGNVYLEAMACAKPVIACNSGGAPEVVLNNQTGILIPPRDITALENAISTMADDSVLRKQLGDNGREWIEEAFSIEKYIDKVERLYTEIIDRAGE
jgi:glycosyltransferase involved in cell wall biosynthesis